MRISFDVTQKKKRPLSLRQPHTFCLPMSLVSLMLDTVVCGSKRFIFLRHTCINKYLSVLFLGLRRSLSGQSSHVTELEQEVEVLEGELSAAQHAAKQAPSRTIKSLVERLRNQLSVKEKQQRVRELRSHK